MIKKLLYTALTFGLIISTCSCALVQKPIDNKTGFSKSLTQTETLINDESWDNAKASLAESEGAWKKIKPMLQIDIDHDYINVIEEDFVKLGAYIDTQEKTESLASIRIIKDMWETIGKL